MEWGCIEDKKDLRWFNQTQRSHNSKRWEVIYRTRYEGIQREAELELKSFLTSAIDGFYR